MYRISPFFQEMPHELYLRQAVEFGCRPEKLDEIVKIHAAGGDMDRINNGDYTEIEKHYAEEMFGKFNHPAKVEQLKDVMDYVVRQRKVYKDNYSVEKNYELIGRIYKAIQMKGL